ncbi:MAG: Collagen-binding adhesin [candidate division TM6 bacterium GW2011_GWF2_38_10]|nr:MAG: Collagen-binding adhesin [candidate division TM6 bacterium GW2011_GWF2_38_10]
MMDDEMATEESEETMEAPAEESPAEESMDMEASPATPEAPDTSMGMNEMPSAPSSSEPSMGMETPPALPQETLPLPTTPPAGSPLSPSTLTTPTPQEASTQLKWPDTIELTEETKPISTTSNPTILKHFQEAKKIKKETKKTIKKLADHEKTLFDTYNEMNTAIDNFLQESSFIQGKITKQISTVTSEE